MRIYIAAPYTKGDVAVNIRRAFDAANDLILLGHTPYIPHWTHFWHIVTPRPYEFWMEYDESFILHWAEAMLYLDGESDGTRREAELASHMGIPIYHSLGAVANATGKQS